MEKLRFEFSILPSSAGKSNIYCVTSIATSENKVYAIPDELQGVSYHKELIKTAAYTKVKNSLKKRYQTRRIWLTMTEELGKTYIDEDGNIQFMDQYLKEMEQKQTTSTEEKEIDMLRLLENKQETKELNLKCITEKIVIERFTSKNSNARQLIDTFEK